MEEIEGINISFKVNKSDVEKTMANEAEAKKVQDVIDNGRTINKVKAVGYASPEGNAERNEKLASERAQSTVEYIEDKLGKDAKGIVFKSEGKGADWDGFFKALEESNISAKAEIAKTIKNSEDPVGTLNQMRVKYPELNNILSDLRVTRVYINK